MKKRIPCLFCLVAGGGDAATGLLLIAAPGLVLRLLGIAVSGDVAYLRFVGVFVGCVGLAYLFPWLTRDRFRRSRRIVSAVEMTAGVRLAVALFLGVAVAAGTLDLPWMTVGVYDAVVATAQLGLLVSGGFGDAV
jgi:hypothetical protein